MEFNREHFRAIILYNFRCGFTQQQYIDELNSIYSDEASSRVRVYRWYGEFNRGGSSLQDEFRAGRPKSIAVPETIDAVRQLILQDRHGTYREIETNLGISGTGIHLILHEQNCTELSKKLARVAFHTICQSIKKRLVEKNAPKIRSRCFETRL